MEGTLGCVNSHLQRLFTLKKPEAGGRKSQGRIRAGRKPWLTGPNPQVMGLAEARPAPAWSLLARLPPHEILTEPRTKLKEQLVKEREDKNIVPKGEAGAEFPWNLSNAKSPTGWWWCART